MAGVGRIAGIVGAIVLVGAGGAYVVGGSARGEGSFTVERAPQTVITWLASAPEGAPVAEGATVTRVVSHEDNVVVADVSFADGRTGRVTYTVAPAPGNPQHSQVELRLERHSGLNPITRFQALTGGDADTYAEAAATSASASLTALRADITPIAYALETLEPQQFFYVQRCTSTQPDSIVSIMRQAQTVIPQLMRANNLQATGPLYAVEPRVEPGRYCYQVGYPFAGTPPGETELLVGETGQTPSGRALRVDYTGTETDVVPQVYDRMDALLAAARLDPTPADQADDWPTMEIYHDDPTQAGGSRNRTIYYIVPSDANIDRLTALAPPTPAGAPAEAQAAGPETPAAPQEPPSAPPVTPAPTTP